MMQFEDRRVDMLRTHLGGGLPDGITAEVEVCFLVKDSDFGEWRCKTRTDAIAVKAKCDSGRVVLNMLPRAIDSDLNFINGRGYVQHRREAVEVYSSAVRAFIREHFEPRNSKISKDDLLNDFDKNPRPDYLRTFFERYDKVVGALYDRLCCIDEDAREWGQWSFADKSQFNVRYRTEVEWTEVR